MIQHSFLHTKLSKLLRRHLYMFGFLWILLLLNYQHTKAQDFDLTPLNFNGFTVVSSGTSLDFGPDGRLYVSQVNGLIRVYTIQRLGQANYQVVAMETITTVQSMPNHDDFGNTNSQNNRQITGLAVGGTATNPVIYVGSSDPVHGGPSGDKNLDTNSGVITQITWTGNSWETIDLVRGLPRSEENHSTNGIELVTIQGVKHLIVCSGGFTNAGAPSNNFAYITEYATSAAVLAINLDMLNGMPTLTDANSGRLYKYDLPTLDDPTRANVNGIYDPNNPSYNGIDVNDPWGGNDGLNQAILKATGPVLMFSPGYRNTYDLVVTKDGKVYVTDNGANGGWGGFPENEGNPTLVSNNYLPNEPGSSTTYNGKKVDNKDHLLFVTNDIQNYTFGSFYGGHPTPVRANPGIPYTLGAPFPFNPGGAGLYTKLSPNSVVPKNGNISNQDVFRTQILAPIAPGQPGFDEYARTSLPANWPAAEYANPAEATFISVDNGSPAKHLVSWPNNTNGIAEYTASNFGGAMKGNLIAGKSGGSPQGEPTSSLHRIILNADGSLNKLEQNKFSTQGGNPLGITCNGDDEVFPGTIWVATFDSRIVIFDPKDFTNCIAQSDPAFSLTADYDNDGFTNGDEIDNGTDYCSGASFPDDYDGDKISNLNDLDDDGDGINDDLDLFQLDRGTPLELPVDNELFSDQLDAQGRELGYRGLTLTGLMNNGAANPNWLNWLDEIDQGPNPNDIMGGAIGAITVNMTGGTALGTTNTQEKGFHFGVNVSTNTGLFTVSSKMANFNQTHQLYQASVQSELGIFIGTGSQSDYVKLVITQQGITMQAEVNDVPSSPISVTVPVASRPNSLEFFFKVNPANGEVEGLYKLENNPAQSIGKITVQGALLAAIQQDNTPMAVGITGTTYNAATEVQGTWDYFKVTGSSPSIAQQIPNFDRFINDDDINLNLDDFFGDDGGTANLSYSIEENSGTDIVASLQGTTLNITIPSVADNATIKVRATDTDGLFVEQTFIVNVIDEPVVVYRVNAGDAQVAATDGKMNWAANDVAGATTGTGFSVNVGNLYTTVISGRHSSLPAYVPQSIFNVERWDPEPLPEMEWTFDVTPGNYEVRLYMANSFAGTSEVGQRVFNINIEGQVVESNIDLVAQFGHQQGGMKSYIVQVNDNQLNILFEHVTENPLINGIEILSLSGANYIPPITFNINNQTSVEGTSVNLTFQAQGGSSQESFTYTATGLPTGLTLNNSTGQITGTLTTAGAYNVSITANKPSSQSVTAQFTWNVSPENTGEAQVLYRVNAGGELITDATEDWSADQSLATSNGTATNGTPSTFVNSADGDLTFGVAFTGVNNTGYPNALFNTERYSLTPNPNNMKWAFPVADGAYTVNLLFAETWTGAQETGIRVFDVNIEGQLVLDDLDQTAKYGWNTVGVETFLVEVTDGVLNIDFIKGIQNPNIKGIEIISAGDILPPPAIPYTWNMRNEAQNYTGRHECSFVQAGDKFYLIGGRENAKTPEIYNYTNNTWTTGALAPVELNHYQAVEYQGLIWAIGSFENNSYPNEAPATHVYMYDPANNVWIQGAEIPVARRRGSAGLVMHNDKFYVVGGNTIGHNGGYVPWFDVFDPATGVWTALPDAPRARDHFHAAVLEGKLYAVGGRLSGGTGGVFAPVIPEVDVYDFTTQTWSQVAQLPTPRAASMVAAFEGKVFVIGGETENNNAVTLSKTEAYNPTTNTWETLDPLINGRHGTQAIVSGKGIFVAAGSPNKGGGTQKNMEYYGENAPVGTPSVPSVLEYPLAVGFDTETTQTITLSNTTGNQAIFIKSINIAGTQASSFSILSGEYSNFIIPAGGTHDLQVELVSTEPDQIAYIDIVYGANSLAQVVLSDGEIVFNELPTFALFPSTQVNVEGDVISLPITADDGNGGTQTLTYSATNLPLGLSIDPNTGIISGTLDEGQGEGVEGAFIENGGIVVIEMESAPNLGDSWETISTYSTTASPNITSPSNAGGGDFIVWQGPQFTGTPGNGLLVYPIQINTPGTYRFQWRSQVGNGTVSTEHNDTWLKIEADAFYGQKISNPSSIVCPKGFNPSTNDCIGGVPAGAGSEGWFKIYLSGTTNWTWSTNTSDNNAHQIFARFDAPGSYNILVSARSSSHAIDRMVLSKTDYSGNPLSLSLPESPRNQVVVGASQGSPYQVTVTATDDGIPAASVSNTFTWIVNAEEVTGTPSANVLITPNTAINASTFGNNSFQIQNTGEVDILSVKFNISTTALTDIVFDPTGTAGDATAKCLIVNSGGAAAGFNTPTNNCVDPFDLPQNGTDGQDGFNQIELSFSDFNTGESIGFAVDIDPTSIKNDQTAGDAGSVSGFELIGGTVTILFANGTEITSVIWDQGSLGGGQAVIAENQPSTAPSISVDGTTENRKVNTLNHTIAISGTPNANITLLQIDARLYIDAGGGGYDITPFEANTALAKVLHTVTLDANGLGSIPVTLLQTITSDPGPDGGINHFLAVETGANGQTSLASNLIILEYDPNFLGNADIELTATLQGSPSHEGEYVLELFTLDNLSTPAYQYTLTADGAGLMTQDNISPDTYKLVVKRLGYLWKVQEVVLEPGLNTLNFGELLAGDINGDNTVDEVDYGLLQAVFFKTTADAEFNAIADFNRDGVINIIDFNYLRSNYQTLGQGVGN